MKTLNNVVLIAMGICLYSCSSTVEGLSNEAIVGDDVAVQSVVDESKVVHTSEVTDGMTREMVVASLRKSSQKSEKGKNMAAEALEKFDKREAVRDAMRKSLTPEDIEIINDQKALFTKYCTIELDGNITFAISKDEAIRKGYSAKAYDKIALYVDGNNAESHSPILQGCEQLYHISFADGSTAQIKTEWKL